MVPHPSTTNAERYEVSERVYLRVTSIIFPASAKRTEVGLKNIQYKPWAIHAPTCILRKPVTHARLLSVGLLLGSTFNVLAWVAVTSKHGPLIKPG